MVVDIGSARTSFAWAGESMPIARTETSTEIFEMACSQAPSAFSSVESHHARGKISVMLRSLPHGMRSIARDIGRKYSSTIAICWVLPHISGSDNRPAWHRPCTGNASG